VTIMAVVQSVSVVVQRVADGACHHLLGLWGSRYTTLGGGGWVLNRRAAWRSRNGACAVTGSGLSRKEAIPSPMVASTGELLEYRK